MSVTRSGFRAVACVALLLLACEDSKSDSVRPSIVLSGDTNAITDGSVIAINGTYTSCLERSGSWSVRISGEQALANSPLNVVTGDTNCVLAVTEIVASQTYTTSTPITLSAAGYQATASAFVASGGSTTAFYANARLNAAGFGADFVISLVYSVDPTATDAGNVSATYATVQSNNQAMAVSPPDYTISFTAGTPLMLQLDAAKVVTATSGTATLMDGAVTGSSYVIDLGTLGNNPNYLAVQAAFLVGPVRTIAGTNPTIPGIQFGLSGVSLVSPVVRTVIVGRLVGSVLGYELIKVTFRAP